jgi:hypothetical protein
MQNLNKIYTLLDQAIKLSDQDSNVETDFAASVSSDLYDLMRKLKSRGAKVVETEEVKSNA